MPLSLDNADVACLVIFPSSLESIWHRFEVPLHLRRVGGLLAALIPWTMSRAEYSAHDIQSVPEPLEPPVFMQPSSYAVQVLQFPDFLRTYMSQPNRAYCVWWSPGDGTTTAPGLETNMLHSIMKSCKAKNVGHKADVRVVFVHVGALESLHKLPALAERRSKRPEIHFYTYGTHAKIPRERWGVHAIYPVGKSATMKSQACQFKT